jgi:alkanesulfonate monooxygenase SsuD/methylene tetrahydromethanopterin reductase-like flavin-dependent oxidoreductase (luciferase family)
VHELAGGPQPAQYPRPPLLVGGGGRGVLELAARTADIVGVHARLTGGRLADASVADFAADRIDEKVRWVRDALRAEGRSSDAVELQFSVYLCRVEGGRRAAQRAASAFADRLSVDAALVADSPAVLIGSIEMCAELLEERRERYGFSYLRLSDDVEAVAPLVRRLAGH